MPVLPGSLRWRLPLGVATLITVVVLAYGVLAWREVRRSEQDSVRGRLQSLSQLLAYVASVRNRQVVQRLTVAASSPSFVAAVDRGDPDAVRDALRGAGFDTAGSVAVAVLHPDRQPMVMIAGDRQHLPPAHDTMAVAPLYVVRDSVLTAFTVPIRVGTAIRGHLTQVVHLFAGPYASRVTGEVLGPGALELVGNADGSVWTDQQRRIPAPVLRPGQDQMVAPDGSVWLCVQRPVPGSPWQMAIIYPLASVHAPSQALARMLAGIAVVLIAVGGAAAVVVSGRITDPLERLTHDAEALASGARPPRSSPSTRGDEIGRLDRAFHRMAREVTRSREGLEREVHERTAELQAAQQALIHRERMAVLGQLAGSVSHELRNPLGVMSNIAYWLDQTIGATDEKVRTRLATLRRQVTMSEKIIADILAFTRVRAPERSVVDIQELVDEQLARAQVPPGVRVERSCMEGIPPVLVDRQQIGQVLLNLLANALQAMEGAGPACPTPALVVRCEVWGERVRVEVADSGPGVPAELREKIFEPLFTTKARGIGLGLAVSRTMVESNDGKLSVEAGGTGGAVFVLDLPAATVP